jgi:DNA-directed RNA polymerase subunit RPC12/RpoP
MRLIDADELKHIYPYDKEFHNVINHARTVKAIPVSAIKKSIEKIENKALDSTKYVACGLYDAIEIIKEYCEVEAKEEQVPITDRIEYGTDGNSYKLTISNGKEFEQEPCEDAVSRQIISDYVQSHIQEINAGYGDLNEHTNRILRMIVAYIETMSSVTPQPKTGHWILIDKELSRYKCSECGEIIRLNKKNEILSLEKDETLNDYPYSHCGAKMQE